MEINVSCTGVLAGKIAASYGATQIARAIACKGECNVVLATGASQFEMLRTLVSFDFIDWSKVTCFHLDEYIGIDDSHPASFVKYLRERFLNQIKVPPKQFHFVNGINPAGAEAECARLDQLVNDVKIDVAFIGIGENGHIAFNDPPADFETKKPFLVVDLDEACRQQQFGEGWFESLEAVPKQAISMSVQQIMKAETLVVTVPEKRKAKAAKAAIQGPVNPSTPASILKRHSHCVLFLDNESSSLLAKP
ncbi:glucosamine-6-phosphate deaminase-like [Oscarella lobularis]|uniref:glucosamine-6-phosphate deaminase-like n=1 Tax=Oscarella lobularis TaxID=121494 RepID=UPI003313466F